MRLVEWLCVGNISAMALVCMVGSFLIIKHRHDFPIAPRNLLTVLNGFCASLCVYISSDIDAFSEQPCFIFHFSIVTMTYSVNFLILRCWRLYVDSRLQKGQSVWCNSAVCVSLCANAFVRLCKYARPLNAFPFHCP